MKSEASVISDPQGGGFKKGFTIEHIMLSITVVSTKDSAGQFDDSCANIRALEKS